MCFYKLLQHSAFILIQKLIANALILGSINQLELYSNQKLFHSVNIFVFL